MIYSVIVDPRKIKADFKNKISLKDINLFLQCKKKGDYTEVYKTKLYRVKSSLYCQLVDYTVGITL